MTKKLDRDTKAILEVLWRYPEGITVNKLYENLKDSRGRHLMSKPTFQKKLQMLKSEKLVIEEIEGEWKKGKSKTIKLKDSHKIIAEKLFEIKVFKDVFTKFLEKYFPKLKSENALEVLMAFNKVELAKIHLKDQLKKMRNEILNCGISTNFKKELLFETLNTEKEIEEAFLDRIVDIKPAYDLYRAYLKTLQEIKSVPERIFDFNEIFERNLSLINKEFYEKLHEKKSELKKQKVQEKYTEEERRRKIKDILTDMERNPERYADFIKDFIEFVFVAPKTGKLTEEIAITVNFLPSFQLLKQFKSEIDSEIEEIMKEVIKNEVSR